MLQIHLSECHAKKFMLSGFKTKKKKTLLCDYITALGGTVVHETKLDWTHLIAEKLTKCEKVLASMAGGKWILTEQYVTSSHAAGHWLLEDVHEWTGAQCDNKVEREVALQARHWRLSGGRPFVNWKCVLRTEGDNHFSRILEKGGALVLEPEEIRQCTHVFLDQKNCKEVLTTALLPLVNDQLNEVLYLDTNFILAVLLKENPDPLLWKATSLLKSKGKRPRSPSADREREGSRRARAPTNASIWGTARTRHSQLAEGSPPEANGEQFHPHMVGDLFHELWEE